MASNNKKNGKKVYHMGKHFKTYHVLSYILVTVVVVIFYFIYNFLFVTETSSISSPMLAAIFVLIEAGLMLLINKGGNWIQKVYYYELDDKGVTIVTNKNRVTYTWDKFTEVHMGLHSFVDLCPVHYTYEGKNITFSQYLEDMWGMNIEIINHISDHVKVPEDMIRQLQSFAKE